MAPRQLRLEPIVVKTTANKGSKRVRVDSNDESSTQVRLRTHAIACACDTTCPSPAHSCH
eukprot:scaffold46023_cov118-Isochrysis_galbana.AAC.2